MPDECNFFLFIDLQDSLISVAGGKAAAEDQP